MIKTKLKKNNNTHDKNNCFRKDVFANLAA